MTNTGLTFQKQDQIQSRLHRAALLFAVLLTAALPLAGQVTPKVGPPGVPQLQFVPAQLSLFAGQSGGGCSDTGIPGPAVSANFCTAAATAVDASGNTYIVDTSLNTVYKVDTSGNISVFAGVPVNSITGSYSGDGGQATAAYLSQPSDVAIDGSGNVYIADYGNGRVRKVDATGKISTFVGGGTGYFNGGTGTAVAISPSGITFDPSGNLYVADNPQSLIIKVTSTGAASLFAGYQTALGQQGTAGYNGDNISAVGAELNYPGYVASDLSGNIYIADITNCRIREVAVATGTITTVAGNGTCGNTGDGGAATSAQIRANTVATDLAGDIYFSNGTSIRRVDTSGNILTIAGGGATLPAGYPTPATSAAFNGGALQTRMDNNGTLLIPVRTSGYQVVAAGPNGDLQFGDQNVGVASSPLTITLTNTGSATLTITPSSFTFGGANPTDFNRQGLTCGYTLAAGASCTIQFVFTPGGAGVRSATMTVPTNASQQSVIVLGGNGVQPVVTASPTSLNFGTELWEHATYPQYVFLTNTSSTYTATLGALAITDGDFTVSAYSCGSTLAPAATCQLSVVFEPLTYANQSYSGTGSIQYTSTAPGGSTPASATFTVTGNGITYPAGVSATPSSIAFGNQTEYTQSGQQVIYVLNESGSAITLTGTSVSPPFGLYNGCPGTLQTGYQCQIQASFAPTSVGAAQAPLTVTYTGATGSPLTVALTGNGTAGTPMIDLEGQMYPYSQVNFGTTPVGTPPLVTPLTQQVTVNNSGTAPMTGIVITITGTNASDFGETDNCAANSPIQPQYANNCVITVSFSAGAAGPRNATLNVSSNAGNSPQSIALTGAGIASAAELQFTPAQLNLIAGSGAACGATTNTTTASSATLCNVNNAAQDYLGNTYLVDTNYNVVYKVDTTGNLSVFAGTPSLSGGYSGDNGPATSATLSGPTAVAADAFGNVFISDTGNNTIREISGGTITTYVNTSGACDEERPASGPQPRIAAPIAKIVNACLQNFTPKGLVFDRSGNLFIADPYNDVVWEVLSQQNYLSLVAGMKGMPGYAGDNMAPGSAELNGPQDVAVDTAGNVYIADTLNYRVRKFNPSGGNITTYAGTGTQGNTLDGGAANVATINAGGVATNLAGDVYISSGAGGIVRKVDTSGNISTIAGLGTGAVGGQATTAAITNAYLSRVDNNGDLLIPTGLQLLAAGPDGILQFGSQAVNVASSALNVLLEDTGNNPLSFNTTIATVNGTNASDFTFGSSCGYNLLTGKTCQLGVTFKPGGTGMRSAYLSIPTNTAGTPQIVLLQGNGTGVTAPVASLTSTIAFPNTTQNVTSASLAATLSNTGNATLNISSIVLGGTNAADFAVVTSTTNPCGQTLAAGASCLIAATFTPLGTSSYTATITVTDNSATPTQSVTLTGTGTAVPAPVASLTSTIAFPNTTQNVTSAALTATLSNTGNATLNFSSIVLGGTNAADFAIVTSTTNPCGQTLAAGASCLIAATFTPLGTSSYTATITVTDNSATPTQSVTLTGTGTAVPAPVASLTSTIAFPNTTQNVTSAALTATLSNTGNATLNFSSIVLGGTNAADFAIVTSTTNPCGQTLAAGASCLIAATFTPLGTSSYTATITVTDNSGTPTQSVTLTGTGVAPAAPDFGISSNTPPQTVIGGNPATYSITVTPVGGSFTGVIQFTATGLPPGSTATFTPASLTPGSSAASSSLVITTIPQHAQLDRRMPWLPPSVTVALLLPLLLWRRRRPLRSMRLSALLLAALLGSAILTLSGCGGGLQLPGTSTTYTIPVTGTSGITIHTTTVTLTVQ